MESLTAAELLYFCFIIFSYAIRGSAGFGGITVPLLAWIMSLKTKVPMVTFHGLLSSIVILRTDYRHVVWRDLWRLLPWIALGILRLGIFIGNRIHANLNNVAFKRLVAVILIISGLPQLIR